MDQSRAIKALSDCGAIKAALETEHAAIENALQALGDAMRADANPEVLTQIMDMIVDFCTEHFQSEEQSLGESGHANTKAHLRDHENLLSEFRAARTAITEGQIDATIDASALLNCFHNHVNHFDQSTHAEVLQQSAGG